MMTNLEYFQPVFDMFRKDSYREFAKLYVSLFPDYFADKPASSSGKYHASWSNLKGGLRDHTHAVCYMTDALSDAFQLDDAEHDAALIAALGHDAVKYGFNGGAHTTKTHESEGALFFKRVVNKFSSPDKFPKYEQVYNAIAFHQGRWAVSETPKKFPEDFDKIGQLVHIADMTASRPQVMFTFLQAEGLIG